MYNGPSVVSVGHPYSILITMSQFIYICICKLSVESEHISDYFFYCTEQSRGGLLTRKPLSSTPTQRLNDKGNPEKEIHAQVITLFFF